MARVLVVGGAGYIGSLLTKQLLSRGHLVRILDRFYFGRESIRDLEAEVELVQADMRRIPESALVDIDAVLNLGGLSNDPTANYNPAANWEMNHVAVIRLAERCKASGIKRYLFTSSCSVYDRRSSSAQTDTLFTEEHPVDPIGHYAEAKYQAEKDLLAMADDCFSPVIFRFGTVFGYSPRMRFDLVVNSMVRDALAHRVITLHGGGETWRPLLNVEDAARALVIALESKPEDTHAQIFNVVYQNLRIAELGLRVQHTLRTLGVSAEVVADYSRPAARNYRVSGQKLENILGFRPEVTVEESVKALVAKFRVLDGYELHHPRFFNIRWMQLLEEAARLLNCDGSVFACE